MVLMVYFNNLLQCLHFPIPTYRENALAFMNYIWYGDSNDRFLWGKVTQHGHFFYAVCVLSDMLLWWRAPWCVVSFRIWIRYIFDACKFINPSQWALSCQKMRTSYNMNCADEYLYIFDFGIVLAIMLIGHASFYNV